MDISKYLKRMVENEASDLYLITGAPPSIKVNNIVKPLSKDVFGPSQVRVMAYEMMTERQIQRFEENFELSLAISDNDNGRFRVNVYTESNEVAMVIRHIKTQIPSMKALHIPEIAKDLALAKSGLVLVVGATGVGKSTTLATMIDYRNRTREGHIVIIEDPIEFIHAHNKSIITQREVGLDTKSYSSALRNTLRQSPDVVLIGEIRDEETMQHAIAFSQTGHLCLSTLHANNASQAIERIVHFFPEDKRQQLRLELSFNLNAIIAQRLIPGIDGKLVPAFEVLLGTPLVRDLIYRNELSMLQEVMDQQYEMGMGTFDQSLLELYENNKISADQALQHADSSNNLRIEIQKVNPDLEIKSSLEIMHKDSFLSGKDDSDFYP